LEGEVPCQFFFEPEREHLERLSRESQLIRMLS